MTIKSRIAFGIASLLVVIALLGGVSVWFFSEVDAKTKLAGGDIFVRLDLAETLIVEVQTLQTALLLIPVSDSADLERRIVGFAERLNQKAPTLLSPQTSAIEEILVEELQADADNLRDIALRFSKENLPSAAVIMSFSEISERLQSIYKYHQELLNLELINTQDITTTALRFVTVLVAICVVYSLLVLVYLPGYVAAPIGRFSQSISRIAEGNFKIRLAEERGDEFGRLAQNFNLMAAQLEAGSNQSLAAVQESQSRLTALVNEIDDMILGMDAERRIVFLNAAMGRYLKLDPQDALGEYMPDLALGRPRLQQLFEPIALGRSTAIEPFTVRQEDGSLRYLQEKVVRLSESANSKKAGDYIVMLSDVTDYEERTHRQTDYLATLSHEMKTPISAIAMSVGLLEDPRLGALDADQQELTQTIRHNASRLLRMINEVLQLSQTEAGATQLVVEQIDLVSVIQECRLDVLPLAHNARTEILLDLPEEGYRLEADRKRIAWVINNLLTNAIRYSPKDSPVKVKLDSVTGGALVSVADRGPGIAPKERDIIFGRFKRAEADATEGTGLGLAISREYVEAHGGRLYVDAAYGPGARFVIELPRRLSQAIRAQQLSS